MLATLHESPLHSILLYTIVSCTMSSRQRGIFPVTVFEVRTGEDARAGAQKSVSVLCHMYITTLSRSELGQTLVINQSMAITPWKLNS